MQPSLFKLQGQVCSEGGNAMASIRSLALVTGLCATFAACSQIGDATGHACSNQEPCGAGFVCVTSTNSGGGTCAAASIGAALVPDSGNNVNNTQSDSGTTQPTNDAGTAGTSDAGSTLLGPSANLLSDPSWEGQTGSTVSPSLYASIGAAQISVLQTGANTNGYIAQDGQKLAMVNTPNDGVLTGLQPATPPVANAVVGRYYCVSMYVQLSITDTDNVYLNISESLGNSAGNTSTLNVSGGTTGANSPWVYMTTNLHATGTGQVSFKVYLGGPSPDPLANEELHVDNMKLWSSPTPDCAGPAN